jgi:mRNA interferase RelE/StbE
LIRYTVTFKASAQKDLAKLPASIQKRIQGVVSTLETNPLPPAARKLVGRDAYRIRVSDYRIIYIVEGTTLVIVIVALGHRGDIDQ